MPATPAHCPPVRPLLDHVWGESDAADHNVVEVYVSSLRRKVDEPHEPSLVETVRGVGYRLRDA